LKATARSATSAYRVSGQSTAAHRRRAYWAASIYQDLPLTVLLSEAMAFDLVFAVLEVQSNAQRGPFAVVAEAGLEYFHAFQPLIGLNTRLYLAHDDLNLAFGDDYLRRRQIGKGNQLDGFFDIALCGR